MSKGIEFNEEQLEGYKNGSTMFLVPVSSERNEIVESNFNNNCVGGYILLNSPLQKGDEFFIQEEFGISGIMKHLLYKDEYPEDKNLNWIPASEMQEHQARFKDVVLDVEVKRVQDIPVLDIPKIQISYWEFDKWLEIQGIKYEENPYVFICTIKGINHDK